MTNNNSDKIIQYLRDKGQSSAKELVEYLGISKQAAFRHLAKLLQVGKIIKIGRPPRVFYSFRPDEHDLTVKITIKDSLKKFIDDNYLIITPQGERKIGWEGFVYWCRRNNFEPGKKALEYKEVLDKYRRLKKQGLIDGMPKIKNTFSQVWLDELYYLDFYSIERFGKTKLGQLLLYAKQSQNKSLIKELAEDIRPVVAKIIKRQRIDAVGFIPPTVKREIQFMRELEQTLHLPLKHISIAKIKTPIIVAQKSLSKLNDRVDNVRNTLVVTDQGSYGKILLIDDAVGSGATLNETAAQIKHKKIAGKVIGLSITGSFKGFDVISEV